MNEGAFIADDKKPFGPSEVVLAPEADSTINNPDYMSMEEEKQVPSGKLAANLLDEKALMFLQSVSANSVKKPIQQLIFLQADDSIKKCMQVLADNGFTSAPVFDPVHKKILGFIDTLDLGVFLVETFAEQYKSHPHLYDPRELEASFSTAVRDAINASKIDPFYPVDYRQNVGLLISNYLSYGIHRVPIKDENGNIIGIVSQSDVVRFLQANQQFLHHITSKRLDEVGLDRGEVISVTNDVPLLKAFTTILSNKITGLAVVDVRTGELVNNLSAGDLKGVTQQTFYKLEAPIHQVFMYSKKMPPVVCSKNSSIGEVMDILATSGVHRVYVMDSDRKPISVITLTDILQLFSTTL